MLGAPYERNALAVGGGRARPYFDLPRFAARLRGCDLLRRRAKSGSDQCSLSAVCGPDEFHPCGRYERRDGAEWYGSCGSTACGSSPQFTIAIYTDDDGLPGASILIRKVGSADQTAIGNDEYAYSVTFPSKTLTPGKSYLFGVYVTAASEPTWGIEETSASPPGSTAALFDMTVSEDWSLIPENLAFNLTGPGGAIPEPSTWAMMILGFAGLGFLGHRQTINARVPA